jgi:hypothetical protein
MAAPGRFADTSDSSCTAGAVHTWPDSAECCAATIRLLSLMSLVKHGGHGGDALHARQREVVAVMDRAEERVGPEDVGDQALMRGLDSAFPFVRPGLSLSGVGSYDRPRR